MKYAIMVLALLGVLARPTAASDGPTTGNEMLSYCEDDRNTCAVYAWGWREGHDVGLATGMGKAAMSGFDIKKGFSKRAKSIGICIPRGKVSHEQLADVLIKYLRSNPETRHKSLAQFTVSAFIKAFPCG